MVRVENWDVALVKFAMANLRRNFRWGVTDCGSIVRRGLTVIMGTNPWLGHIPTWSTKRQALETCLLMEPENALRGSGAVEVGNRMASAGDVALAPSHDDHGMVGMSLVLPARRAMISTPRTGVVQTDLLFLPEGTRFFRYE